MLVVESNWDEVAEDATTGMDVVELVISTGDNVAIVLDVDDFDDVSDDDLAAIVEATVDDLVVEDASGPTM